MKLGHAKLSETIENKVFFQYYYYCKAEVVFPGTQNIQSQEQFFKISSACCCRCFHQGLKTCDQTDHTNKQHLFLEVTLMFPVVIQLLRPGSCTKYLFMCYIMAKIRIPVLHSTLIIFDAEENGSYDQSEEQGYCYLNGIRKQHSRQ